MSSNTTELLFNEEECGRDETVDIVESCDNIVTSDDCDEVEIVSILSLVLFNILRTVHAIAVLKVNNVCMKRFL